MPNKKRKVTEVYINEDFIGEILLPDGKPPKQLTILVNNRRYLYKLEKMQASDLPYYFPTNQK